MPKWLFGLAIAVVTIGVAATIAAAVNAPSNGTTKLTSVEKAKLTRDTKEVNSEGVNNKLIHASLSREDSDIDTAGALAALQEELAPDALGDATKITATKVRLVDDAAPASVMKRNALVWIISLDGIRTMSHGGSLVTSESRYVWNQMNYVIDANTGAFVEAYPGVSGQYPVSAP